MLRASGADACIKLNLFAYRKVLLLIERDYVFLKKDKPLKPCICCLQKETCHLQAGAILDDLWVALDLILGFSFFSVI